MSAYAAPLARHEIVYADDAKIFEALFKMFQNAGHNDFFAIVEPDFSSDCFHGDETSAFLVFLNAYCLDIGFW